VNDVKHWVSSSYILIIYTTSRYEDHQIIESAVCSHRQLSPAAFIMRSWSPKNQILEGKNCSLLYQVNGRPGSLDSQFLFLFELLRKINIYFWILYKIIKLQYFAWLIFICRNTDWSHEKKHSRLAEWLDPYLHAVATAATRTARRAQSYYFEEPNHCIMPIFTDEIKILATKFKADIFV